MQAGVSIVDARGGNLARRNGLHRTRCLARFMSWKLCAILVVGMAAIGCQSPRSAFIAARKAALDSRGLEKTAQAAADAEQTATNAEVVPPDDADAIALQNGAEEPSLPHAPLSAPDPEAADPPAHSDTKSVAADLQRARQEADQGRIAAAKAIYQQILAADAGQPDAHWGLAVLADLEHNFRAAEFHYQSARARKAGDADLLTDLGYSYLLQGRFRESEEVLREALRVRPDHRGALSNLGALLALTGNYEQAFEALRLAVGDDEAQARLSTLRAQSQPHRPAPDALAAAAPPAELRIEPRTREVSSLAGGPSALDVMPGGLPGVSHEASRGVAPAVAEFSSPQMQRTSQSMPANMAAPRPIDPGATFETVDPGRANGMPTAGAPIGNANSHWPPPRSQALPQGYGRIGSTAGDDSLSGVGESAELARRAAVLGLNSGPTGPFPILLDSRRGSLGTGAMLTGATSPGPVNEASSADGNDPLAQYEAELRRRAAPSQILSQTYRTGPEMPPARSAGGDAPLH